MNKPFPNIAGTGNRPDPFIGKMFGHCEIQEKINEGGTAYIYKAFNNSFKLFRVLKILKPSLSEEEDFYIRFIQEAQLTARLDHPNILRVFNTGEINGFYYIEMEYIEGRSLRTFISEQKKISEREILHIAYQLVKALEYAHNIKLKAPSGEIIKGILHRDLKPENIMIMPNKTVKLMDFGAAKALNITSNTMQGMIVGTFHYMSPEQIEGKNLDPRSDFFSLGIVLYELFTGQKPFSSEKLVQLIDKIKTCKFKALRKVRPSISPLTEELIDKLLSKKPDHRPRTTKEINETIQICIQAYSAWGTGKQVKVPFSFKRFYPTLALMFSCAALAISLLSYFQYPILKPEQNSQPVKVPSISLLEKGRNIESKKLWKEAISIYELVPSVSEGGVANEYLEAQIRCARICFMHLNQFTKARSILEQLRMEYSDPAIDGYLGQIYFRLAIYNEARDRLNAAVNSQKGSVIPQTRIFKRNLLYYYANSLDRQYTYVEKSPSILMDAIKAWNYYCEFSDCEKNNNDRGCVYAKTRLKELEKINKE